MPESRKKLFEYAILLHPKSDDKTKADPPSQILVHPTSVLAFSEKEASMVAATAIEAEFMDRLEEVEIIVRPF